MAQLYSVSFTTKKLVKKFGARGKLISEEQLETPIVMHALPYATAMSYSGIDNFKITEYHPEDQRTAKGTGRDSSVGNGTKRVSRSTYSGEETQTLVKAKSAKNKISEAAATGNMGASLNV